MHYDVVARFPRLPRDNDRLPATELTLAPGGMGGNVAAAFARLGGRARFAGQISQDDDGDALRADLARDGVDLRSALPRPADIPYRGFILVGEAGERAILGLWPTANMLERSPGQAPGIVRHRCSDVAARLRRYEGEVALDPTAFTPPVTACYCPVSFAPRALPLAPPSLPVFMDLETGHIAEWDDDQVRRALRRATVLFGNTANLAMLSERLAAPLPALSAALGPTIIETAGRDGCRIHASGGSTHVAGYQVDTVDSTGAGDCFAAAFALAFLRGADLVACARFANAAAALSTRRLGSRPGVPDAAELAAFRAEHDPEALPVALTDGADSPAAPVFCLVDRSDCSSGIRRGQRESGKMSDIHVQLRDLSKSFVLHVLHGKRIVGFEEVSFDVPCGAFVGVSGQSGSGKSSLLKCLYRTYLADSGSILLTTRAGERVDLATVEDDTVIALRLSEIGYVSQFLRPTPRVPALDLAARPLIRRGMPKAEAHERVISYFQRLSLPEDLWDGYPILFSGGEQQRVNLARALASDARLLLLDEPTSALDSALQAVVVELLAERRDRGTTMIGIMHDASLLRDLSDVVLHMEQGRIVATETLGNRFADVLSGSLAIAG